MQLKRIHGIFLALVWAIGAHADPVNVIRVDMQPNSGWTSFDFTGVEANAASADPIFGSNGTNTWNHLGLPGAPSANVNPSFSNLVNSAGTATSVGLSFIGTVYSASDSPIDNSGSDAVENDYFLINPTAVTYTISGLPVDTSVAFYLYAPNFSHYDSSNPVGQPSRAFTLTANGQSIFVPSGTGTNDALATVTTDALGDISGTWSTAGNEGDWSGFQLAWPLSSGPSAPEPASLFLLGTGLCGFVCWKRFLRRA